MKFIIEISFTQEITGDLKELHEKLTKLELQRCLNSEIKCYIDYVDEVKVLVNPPQQ